MQPVVDNVLELIGATPLVRIRRLNRNSGVEVYGKLEAMNPGGSVKDRIARQMIEEAERRGELTPEKTIIEATSGNTGIGLAMVAAVKGYRLTLAMAETASQERQKILKALGAEILLTPGALGTDGAIEKVYELVRTYPDRYYMPDQFNNEANWQAHYHGTGREIWEQTDGKVTHVVVALGTTGTAMGIAKRLREYSDSVKIVAVEPFMGHRIQGLKNMKESYVPGIFDKSCLDEIVHVEDSEAFETARKLAREEGIFVGMSSGAAMAAALRLAAKLDQGLVVAILPDGGERYLSTNLFTTLMEPDCRFYNTISRQKEDFKPLAEGKATMFTTGVSLRARLSMDDGRRFVVADLIRRYLQYKGFEVTQVVNINDMGEPSPGQAMADRDMEPLLQDLEALRVHPATLYARVSEHLPDIQEVCSNLVEKGYAYEKLRSVYFDISRFDGYGRLSGVDIMKIKPGVTVDLDAYEKLNPRDFTLLRRATLAELKQGVYLRTRWGNVVPSWHLETVALALRHLGTTMDIHVSGVEFLFPHNENERAIAEALTGKPLANYYLHCERVLVEGRKVSRDGDRRLAVADIIQRGYSGRQLRYWFLTTHYRKPLDYDDDRMVEAARGLQRLDDFIERLAFHRGGEAAEEVNQLMFELEQGFDRALADDLNTPQALAALFRFVRQVNRLLSAGRVERAQVEAIRALVQKIDGVLQILQPALTVEDEECRQLLERREQARREHRWEEADRIRAELQRQGIQVIDTPEGPRCRRDRPAS